MKTEMYKLTRDELLSIKRLLALLHADWHNPGAAKYVTAGQFDCDREVKLALFTIDDVLKCDGEIPKAAVQNSRAIDAGN